MSIILSRIISSHVENVYNTSDTCFQERVGLYSFFQPILKLEIYKIQQFGDGDGGGGVHSDGPFQNDVTLKKKNRTYLCKSQCFCVANLRNYTCTHFSHEVLGDAYFWMETLCFSGLVVILVRVFQRNRTSRFFCLERGFKKLVHVIVEASKSEICGAGW